MLELVKMGKGFLIESECLNVCFETPRTRTGEGELLVKTGQDLLISLLLTPLISEREWYTTLMCRPVPQSLF